MGKLLSRFIFWLFGRAQQAADLVGAERGVVGHGVIAFAKEGRAGADIPSGEGRDATTTSPTSVGEASCE